ncbi:RtcB family protein, partial [Streptomyces scabiei]
FAWREEHEGVSYWVVRKGATPAFPGQKGFVGGSMGDISVILEGVESEDGKSSLYSTVHGAGRVLSRTQAAGRKRGRGRREGGQITP